MNDSKIEKKSKKADSDYSIKLNLNNIDKVSPIKKF